MREGRGRVHRPRVNGNYASVKLIMMLLKITILLQLLSVLSVVYLKT